MEESVIQKIMQESFPISNKELWKISAMREVDGDEAFKKLTWADQDGITYSPYYTFEDIAAIRSLGAFQHDTLKKAFFGSRAWINMPAITVNDEISANKIALEHLAQGADGLLFDLNQKPGINFAALLTNIELQYCAVSFYNISDNFFSDLNKLFDAGKINRDKLSGCIFGIKPEQSFRLQSIPDFGNLRSYGCFISSSTPVKEITDALAAGVSIADVSGSSNYRAVFKNIAFSLPVSTNFLNEISKLRALRILWYQVVMAYGVKDFHSSNLHIHCRCEKWVDEKFSPHANMLGNTTAAIAAISGGCDALTVHPEDENNPVMNRIARNVSNILREESWFDKVSDPLAGSYVVEVMTDSIAKEAWAQFQLKMSQG
jgi:methylmalonyl-CoA mutase